MESSRPEYKNIRVGSYSHLQGIFPTQGLNPGLPHCRQILYQLSHQGSIHTHTHTHRYIYTHTHTYIHTYIYIFLFIFFHFDLSLDVEYSSLCFTVGPCCLSVLYVLVYICQSQTTNTSLSHPTFSFTTTSLFSMSVSLFLFHK